MSKTPLVVASACVGAAVGFGLARYLTQQRIQERKDGVDQAAAERFCSHSYGNEEEATREEQAIWLEQFVRTRQFFEEDGMQELDKSYVVVVGVGGVGSHCAISLARNGVRRLRLIDFDQVTVSSLNRHACATRADVGLSKVVVLKNAIQAICSRAQVEICPTLFKCDSAEGLICGGFNGIMPDFVVDCIDNVPSKVELITFCHHNHIRCISSGGAGGKSDPTKIRIDDIALTTEDNLCRSVRLRLRTVGITSGPMFCYSTERNSRKLLPLHDFQKDLVDEYRMFDQFRVRIIPVIGPMPAILGQAVASFVLCELGNRPIGALETATREASSVDKISEKNYRLLFHAVKQYSNQHGKVKNLSTRELELDYLQTRNLYIHHFKGCSVISQKHHAPGLLQIVPWRRMQTGNSLVVSFHAPRNLVCMTREEAQIHLRLFDQPGSSSEPPTSIESIWDSHVISHVDALLAAAGVSTVVNPP